MHVAAESALPVRWADPKLMIDNPFLREKYRIERLIGSGSFSSVYRALELRCDRRVAIKALRRDVYENSYRYIVSEIGAMGRTWQHPNIVSIHTVEPGDDEHVAYIVMEYVPNGSLHVKLQQAPLPFDECLGILTDICSGLAHVHRQNVIHRDIKPKNILIDADGISKVSDFGVAQVRDAVYDYASTFAGTRRYMAPEQYDGQHDHRVDIFTVGILFWEMLTGTFPYPGTTHDEVRDAKKTISPELPSIVPKPAREIVSMCLRPEPHDRVYDTDQLLVAINRIRESEYERVGAKRLMNGTPVEQLETAIEETRRHLRIPASTARWMRQASALEQRQRLKAESDAEAIATAATRLQAAADLAHQGSHEQALREIEAASATGVLADGLVDAIRRMCSPPPVEAVAQEPVPQPATEHGTRRETGFRTDTRHRQSDSAALETTTRSNQSHGRAWATRRAYRQNARKLAKAAARLEKNRRSVEAGDAFRSAGESAAAAGNTHRAARWFLQSVACYAGAARAFEASGDLTAAADAYRRAGNGCEQATVPARAIDHYESALKALWRCAEAAFAEGRVSDAASMCRSALALAGGTGAWQHAGAVRELQRRIRSAQSGEQESESGTKRGAGTGT